MPSLENLKESYKGKPFKVLLISVMESEETVKNYFKKENLTVRVLIDRFGKVSAQYNVQSHPIKFLISGEGELLGVGLGYRNWDSEEMNKLVNILIQKTDGTPKA